MRAPTAVTLGLATALLIPPGAASAGALRLVRDINSQAGWPLGSPCTSTWAGPGVARLGERLLISATGNRTGCELFEVSTAGTPETRLLREIDIGGKGGAPEFLGIVDGRMLFAASTTLHGKELWRTDGTKYGTVQVREIAPGPESSWPAFAVELGGVLLFEAGDPVAGRELWRTDGTAEGTWRVEDVFPGPESGLTWSTESFRLTRLGDWVYFAAEDGVSGAELWRSDGTAAGTERVADLNPGPDGSAPRAPVVFAGRLYFFATAGGVSTLWATAGAPGDLEAIADFTQSEDWNEAWAGATGIFFYAEDAAHGRELWFSDGTLAGTGLALDLIPGPNDPWYGQGFANGGLFLFFVDDGVHGAEPWISDGTAAGTTILGDIRPGPDGSAYLWSDAGAGIAASGSGFLLALDDGTTGREPWFSDGTPAGTAPLPEVFPGPDSSYPRFVGSDGGAALFVAEDPVHGSELWRATGAGPALERLSDLGTFETSSGAGYPVRSSGLLLFGAYDGSGHYYGHPWRSDGTFDGTFALAGDLGDYGGAGDVVPLANGLAVGLSESDDAGDMLWSTDGESLTLLGPQTSGCGTHTCGLPSGLHGVGGVAVFGGRDAVAGRELWVTDGTPAGTGLLLDLNAGPTSSDPNDFVDNCGAAGFVADDGIHGTEPWLTEGTVASTRILADILPGPAGSGAWQQWPWDVGGASPCSFFYQDWDPVEEWQLWFYDAANLEARRVGWDFHSYDLEALGGVGDRFLFQASRASEELGAELWVSDGTEAGTHQLREIMAGPGGADLLFPAPLGGRIYFRACDFAHGCELWRTDGTAAGTELVKDIVPGRFPSYPSSIRAIGGRLYFAACQWDVGCELWISDGSGPGTHRVDDLFPGAESSLAVETSDSWYDRPPYFARLGDEVFFAADDGTGDELWALRVEIFYDGFESGNPWRWSEVGGASGPPR